MSKVITKEIEKEYKYTTATIKEIANYHHIKYNTLKSYRYRHNWQKHSRTIKRLDRIYSPMFYSDMTYKRRVFALMIGFFNIGPVTAYYHLYKANEESSRVNTYRLLRDDKVRNLIISSRSEKDNYKRVPYQHGINYRLEPCNALAYMDARFLAFNINDWIKMFNEQPRKSKLMYEDLD